MTRPTDVWRACGRRLDPAEDLGGCTCNTYDPTPLLVRKALERLTEEQGVAPS